MRIGIGVDVHKLVEGRDLVLGGLKLDFDKGLLGHSDADVLVHAIMDSILGALSLGDIGKLFPDTDPLYKDISSMVLLEKVYELMDEKGYRVGNIDVVVCAQRPKLRDHIDQMRLNISKTLRTDMENISIKATTTEELGYVGREEGMEARSVCLLISK